MCGRYRLSRRKQIIEEFFGIAPWDDDWSPRYNIAPTQPVPVIRQHPREPARQVALMKWGLNPTLVESPFYRDRHDQREIGDCRDEARVSRSFEIPKVLDSG